jgi:hypothetical protein
MAAECDPFTRFFRSLLEESREVPDGPINLIQHDAEVSHDEPGSPPAVAISEGYLRAAREAPPSLFLWHWRLARCLP